MEPAPRIVVTPIIHHPDDIFLATEANEPPCTKALGSLKFPNTLTPCWIPATATGNHFVYKKERSCKPTRAFLFGEIRRSEYHKASRISVLFPGFVMLSSPPVNITRHFLGMVTSPTTKAKAHYAKDVSMLTHIMATEATELSEIGQPWVWRLIIDSAPEECIAIDCCELTKEVNGPIEVGSSVLVDATFHRQDIYIRGTSVKAYSIVVHDIEKIGRHFLCLEGLVLPEVDGALAAGAVVESGTYPDATVETSSKELVPLLAALQLYVA
ncbi:hypothetical protein DFH09DRAFT_1078651 [Mycena vulgaris]|nr:hypothetical protein DFH09DRAFT_1078651 [Mycena vulgaris]